MDQDQKYKVFVVDDSKVSRRIITTELSNVENIDIKEFSEPLTALDAIEEEKPNMLVTDMVMPKMDGIELCFAAHQIIKDLPVVLITGTLDNDLIVRSLQSGVDETLPKPFKLFQLSQIVERYMSQFQGKADHSILLVDDQAIFRKIITQSIESLNLKIYEANSPIEAEELLKKHAIDIIYSDDEMPEKMGSAWCKEIKENEDLKHIPFVGISSNKKASPQFLNAGADDFIAKEDISSDVFLKTRNLLHRVKLEKELHEKIKNEQALNYQKNKLLGVAAHDLRNPLSFTLGCIELIKTMVEDEMAIELLSKIENTSNNMLDLLNDILNVSSIESGNVKVAKTQESLKKCIHEAIEELNIMAKNKNIMLKTEIDESLGDVEVKIDKKRIHQVISNLLSNAIKYSEQNTTVKIRITKQVEGWVVDVADQGQGIPEDEQAGIFDEFKKTSVQSTAGESSTGLGLAIVKKLVQVHGGNIWLESKPGKGSTFSFMIPTN